MSTSKTNLLTGIRDVDREILNKMSDRDFLQMCSINKTYSERVCDETYFRLRTLARFPETIHYKDYVKLRTWKNHYLAVVYYIDLLQTKYGYEYKSQDKSPELLYLAMKPFSKTKYNKDTALIYYSEHGYLSVVKYLIEEGVDIHFVNDTPLRLATIIGHYDIVEYLVRHGADIDNSEALIHASAHGYLSILKYLVEQGANIHIENDAALSWACQYGQLDVVKYLVRHGVNVNANNRDGLILAIIHGHLSIVKYLVENGANLSANNNEALRFAREKNQYHIIEYLESLN